MLCRDLRDFMALIEGSGELHRVSVEVDPNLELAAITDRACKLDDGGSALVFESVKGSSFRVASNLFGSEKRVAIALGLDKLDDLTCWLKSMLEGSQGETALSRLAALPLTDAGRRVAPVIVSEAPCQVVIHDSPDLCMLPVPRNWPGDGDPDHDGRFITLPLVITNDPESGSLNCGMYRVSLLGPDRLAISWSPGSGGSAHAASWLRIGESMPVAIAVGGPPALTFAATISLPDEVDEYLFAGLIQGEAVQVVRCLTSDLVVPAGAEFVIEGVIEPGATAGDGAFGNHTGYYKPSTLSPMVRVTAITHRHDMIYPTTVVGPPPMEDCWLAAAASRLMLAMLQVDLPQVVSLHQPLAGIFHGGTVVSVSNADSMGMELIARIRETRGLTKARMLILVDEEQSPDDIAGVYWRVMNNVDWGRDLLIEDGCLSMDATLKRTGNKSDRVPLKMNHEILKLVEQRWQEYGFTDGR